MGTLSTITCFCTRTSFPRSAPLPFFKRNPPTVSLFRATSQPVREIAEEDVLTIFLKEREINGDFVSKASDMFWLKGVEKFVDFDTGKLADNPREAEQVMESDDDRGFLKLSKTQEWILGDDSAPMNKKAIAKLKRELMLLSVAIGTACSGYCLIALSVQAAISYVIGVLFSCLYLQLLYQHADNLSKDMIPPIFRQKKPKKIGIRSEDLRDSLERSITGSSIALSSPRLLIPAAIYGLWFLSHQFFGNDVFDFQLVPAMFGMFVYKAAALVQLYRDNEDLQFVFPEEVEGSSD
ncbi:hypothetical protein P3X46_000019 [Hevea brasiliensis]|uniref:NF-kappa-B inhibitor-like protein 2 n=1 Tax=Hevea brasiliensis TaxID=3981 RepID=A0ABQ9N8P5_HEVBR|nr:uncharacterized protein LOC110640142 isoform X3 [Hevea brasiliensis]KAJ9188643.1 hypothetical protein P3X46_000019 [Hevea brasiliensis]